MFPQNTQLKYVVPDLKGQLTTLSRRKIICIIIIPICFIGFGLGGALSAIVGLGFIALALGCFFGLQLSVFTMVYSATRKSATEYYLNMIATVESTDKILIRKFSGSPAMDLSTAQLFSAFITTGNLPDYHLVSDVEIVKNDLYVTEDDALEDLRQYMMLNFPQAQPAQEQADANPEFCPQCGKQITPSARYCDGCGARLFDR